MSKTHFIREKEEKLTEKYNPPVEDDKYCILMTNSKPLHWWNAGKHHG